MVCLFEGGKERRKKKKEKRKEKKRIGEFLMLVALQLMRQDADATY